MNIEKLNPWNWFKHEEGNGKAHQVPVSRGETADAPMQATGPSSLMRLQRDMDQWFEQAFNSFGMPLSRTGLFSTGLADKSVANFFKPQIDVSGDDNRYEIALDVPDMSESDISIEVKNDMLLIKGHKEEKSEDKDKQYYRVERSYGSFQRTLALPDDANADEIKAELDKGVLRLEIPRRQLSGQDVKKISISS